MNLKQIKKTMVLQQDTSDCGVACLLSLIRFYGGDGSLEKLRELSGTSTQGTSLLGLYQAAGQMGFDAEGCEADMNALIEHRQPIILHVVIEQKLQHYMVCYGFENDKFVIFNPSQGIVYYTKEELENIWQSHTCLTLSINDKFVKKESIQLSKKRWIIDISREDFDIIASSVFLGIAIAVLGMTTAVFSQKLIDVIIPEKDFKRLWIGIALVGVLLFTRIGIGIIRQYLLFIQSRNFNNRIIAFFYNKLLSLPKSFFDTRKIGDLTARLNDTRRIQNVISTLAGSIIIDALATIITLTFLFYYSWQIALIIIGSLPFFAYFIYRNNTSLIGAQREVMASYANSESNFIHTMQGIDTIKNFNQQPIFEEVNRKIYGLFQDKIFGLGKINIRLSAYSGIIGVILTILTIAVGSVFVLNGTILLGELMAIISIVASITPSVVNLSLAPIPINEAKVAFNRMFEIVNIPSEKMEGVVSQTNVASVKIRNLSFRFAGRKQILRDVSMNLLQGKMTFLIGESGSGKSTFCKIIEKFYAQEFGEILVNETVSLKETATDTWRNIVGVIPQDIFIFNGTIIENICINANQEQMQKAIRICAEYGIDKYFLKIPQAYMTIVGENGINLSGGEKQMIALARILVKNPQIMILDEPTSAMDKETETLTLEILKSLKENKIIFFVSHRLHILKRYADFIYLLDKGSISHFGTHTEMLQSENLYSTYWKELMQ
ncbi:MAG: peptidase domain-containing ABC transporter [Dysgonamonadaceae bacterium]|jgi:ATP-binding cassette subfamily B protein|nr:peptidase domain-containing ABC transporter [Dysgonamonadaceae bacterium]